MAKLNSPLPVTAEETSNSTTSFKGTAPSELNGSPSISGALSQTKPSSVQGVSESL